MKLMTKAIEKVIPNIYEQDGLYGEAIVYVKFFTPDSNWTWLATEFDGKDTFFGLVVGMETELGYFSLKELQSVRGPLGLPIERDRHFGTPKLKNVLGCPEWLKEREVCT